MAETEEPKYWYAQISTNVTDGGQQRLPSLFAYLMGKGIPLQLTKRKLLPTQSEETAYHLNGCTALYSIFNDTKEIECISLIGTKENLDNAIEGIKKRVPQSKIATPFEMGNGQKNDPLFTKICPSGYYDLEGKFNISPAEKAKCTPNKS